ncbi:hypothetical protein ACCT14_33005 [Rhizobium brockwellii]|uniref:hypothetical protein n=1 Tax=Rhizobium brockwellii TaxID=3019932 RepID=UPI003F9A0758
MSRRVKTAEESARRETAAAKSAMYTLLADSTAPRDPRGRGDHFRKHLVDAHRTIEILQLRIKDLEQERDKIKQAREYDLSLCVTRTAAEEARMAAARWMQERAATLFEDEGGVPTPASEAIRDLPYPRPKWST